MYHDDDGFSEKPKQNLITTQQLTLNRTYDRVSAEIQLLSNSGQRFEVLIEFNAKDRFAYRINHAVDAKTRKPVDPDRLQGIFPAVRQYAMSYWKVTNDAPPEHSLPHLDHMLAPDLRVSIGERAMELTHNDPDRRRGINFHISYLHTPDEDGWQYVGYLVRYARKAIESRDTYWGVYYKPATADVQLGQYRPPDYAHMEVIPFTEDGLIALMAQAKASIVAGSTNASGYPAIEDTDLYTLQDTWESYLESRNQSGYGLVGRVIERGEKGKKWDVWYHHETGERFIRMVGVDERLENYRVGVTRFSPRRSA